MIDYTKYKLRKCRTLNGCAICKKNIVAGEQYYDGGYNYRAHKKCIEINRKEEEKCQ